jgi:hypothetical protein
MNRLLITVLIKAFHETFPNAEIAGCEFHWKSCLTSKIDNVGLKNLYSENIEFILLVRYIWALAFVPLDKVVSVWETVIQEKVREGCLNWEVLEKDMGTKIGQFLKYVDITWIGELNARTKIRKRPLYPHTLWNKFEATLNGDKKTNNLCEGYNHAFGLSLPAKATDWTVMDRFRTEDATTKTVLHQAAMGNNRDEDNRVQKRRSREEKFKSLVGNYENVSIKAYMESIVTFFEK